MPFDNQEEQDKRDILLYGHKLPSPDPAYCSHCRKSIIHEGSAKQNVVRINQAPERVLSVDGKDLGVEGKLHAKAFFHTPCFQEIADRNRMKGRIECKHCGVLSMAKTLKDGRRIQDVCVCTCHEGREYCSILIV
jgi:hypothetical protein